MATLDNIDHRGIIDSRDIIARIEEIETEIIPPMTAHIDAETNAELDGLRAIAEEGIPDWQYGATLIREDSFEDYARELAEDIGAIDRDASWPLSYIDWTAAADALKMDYSTVEIDGDDWYYRA